MAFKIQKRILLRWLTIAEADTAHSVGAMPVAPRMALVAARMALVAPLVALTACVVPDGITMVDATCNAPHPSHEGFFISQDSQK